MVGNFSVSLKQSFENLVLLSAALVIKKKTKKPNFLFNMILFIFPTDFDDSLNLWKAPSSQSRSSHSQSTSETMVTCGVICLF